VIPWLLTEISTEDQQSSKEYCKSQHHCVILFSGGIITMENNRRHQFCICDLPDVASAIETDGAPFWKEGRRC
jgi:hypothetical protein